MGKMILANIECYSDYERTKLVRKFNSFSEVRKFLNVSTLGDSLEKASEKRTMSRGYYWKVENIREVAQANSRLEKFLMASKEYIGNNEFFIKFEESKSKFIERFPYETLIDLPIEQYIVLKAKYPESYDDTFTYWLERKDDIGGAIGGGNSSKFYLYMDTTGKYCTGYGSKKRYVEGEELKYEYNKLISKIVDAINLAKEDKVDEIKTLETPRIWNMVLLKILSIYVPEKFIDIYSSSVLIPLAEMLNLDIDKTPENIIIYNYDYSKCFMIIIKSHICLVIYKIIRRNKLAFCLLQYFK